MNPKYLNDNDPWMLAEDIPDIDFQFSEIWLSAFVNDLEKTVGINYKKVLCVYDGMNLAFYYGEKDSCNFSSEVFKQIKNNPDFGKEINQKIRKFSDDLKTQSGKIDAEILKTWSNQDLADFYERLDELHTKLYAWGWLPNAVDMFHANFTNYIKSLLQKKVSSDKVNQVLNALSVYPEKSIIQREHESFLNLVAMAQSGEKKSEQDKALAEHLSKYFYLKYLWIGKDGVYNQDYYRDQIEEFIKSGENAVEKLKEIDNDFSKTLNEREGLLTELNFTDEEKELIDVYAEFAVTKLYRRDAQIYWAYKMSFVFKELAKRFNIPLTHTHFMLPEEVKKVLLQEGYIETISDELNKRVKHCTFYAEKGKMIVATGKQAVELEQSIPEAKTWEADQLEGQAAYLGKVAGKVRIINSASEMGKMKSGDILVSIATNPDIVPAMKKAGAIVTEQGGITSHAAIVARELKTPCVIGVKNATQVFKDGDLVEVDAEKGIVKKA